MTATLAVGVLTTIGAVSAAILTHVQPKEREIENSISSRNEKFTKTSLGGYTEFLRQNISALGNRQKRLTQQEIALRLFDLKRKVLFWGDKGVPVPGEVEQTPQYEHLAHVEEVVLGMQRRPPRRYARSSLSCPPGAPARQCSPRSSASSNSGAANTAASTSTRGLGRRPGARRDDRQHLQDLRRRHTTSPIPAVAQTSTEPSRAGRPQAPRQRAPTLPVPSRHPPPGASISKVHTLARQASRRRAAPRRARARPNGHRARHRAPSTRIPSLCGVRPNPRPAALHPAAQFTCPDPTRTTLPSATR